MRIAHITATFPPYHGGTGNVCYHNALGLGKRGHDVTVYTANNISESTDYPAEITVKHLRTIFRIGNAPLLPGLFKLSGHDLVHLHYPFVFGAEMVFLRSLAGMPYVVTYHQDLLYSGVMGGMAKVHHSLIGQHILKQARCLLVTSIDYSASARIAPITKAIADRVQEIPNGVDAQRFHPELNGTVIRTHYQVRDDETLILFVGGLDRAHYFKGVTVLLHAFTKLQHNAHLLIVGDGDLKEDYVQLAQQLGMMNRVNFCGRVADDELPLYYAACDMLVLPSTTMGEAFGVVLLEAMACGKAVIASNLPGVRSVVDADVTGLLVEAANSESLSTALLTLAENPDQRRDMGTRGREKVETQYTWPMVNARLEQVYTGLMRNTQ